MKQNTIYSSALYILAAVALILGGTGCAGAGNSSQLSSPTAGTQAHADNGGTGTGAPVSHVGPSGAGPAGSR